MKFNLKQYKGLKIKNYIKTNSFFFIYNSNNLNFKNWIVIEQELKILKLKYYKPNNKITKIVLKNSKYVNFKTLINSLIILIKPTINTKLQTQTFLNSNNFLIPIGILLNKVFYNKPQVQNLHSLKYQTNLIILIKSLKISLKKIFKIL